VKHYIYGQFKGKTLDIRII